ncbi:MAG: acetyltransferase [Proteobacteria bacterium]|nr:acetyltransferase [Pseudomonadota bacterium]
MTLINQGEYQDPWRGDGEMGEAPWLHPTAIIRNTEVGAWTAIGPRCEVFDSVIGDWTYLVKDNQLFNAEIGKFGNIASNVRINPTNHPFWRATLHHFTYRSRSHRMGVEDDAEIFEWRREHRVTIGHDVWIGHGAILLPGVSVGLGGAIGAGAVVTKDVAPYTIVAGNPARPIRRRVTEEVEAALRRIAWWDWPHDRLTAALPDFRALDAAGFAARHDPDR